MAVKARAAIVKLIEGYTLDPLGATNWSQSRGLLPRAGYCFFHPDMDGAEQASQFLAAFGDDFGEFGPCIDVEAPTTKNAAGQTVVPAWSAAWVSGLRECLKVLEATTGRVPIIYTGAWFWQPAIGNQTWAARYPLWVASYTPTPIIPAPWTNALIHQYTSSGDGKAYGCQSTGLDLNRFLGTEQEFQAFIGRTEEQTMSKVRVTVGDQTVDVALPATISLTEVPEVALGVWHAEFYSGIALAGAAIATKDYADGDLSMQLGTASPVPGVVPVDKWSARFTRTAHYTAGHYKATVGADDGVRLYVDGALKIDSWRDQVATLTAEFDLTAGEHTFVVEYYENGGAANLSVVIAPF
jgi:GH25 family lysozyme M1 (1,4-beta-N-acetylmuramidase)